MTLEFWLRVRTQYMFEWRPQPNAWLRLLRWADGRAW